MNLFTVIFVALWGSGLAQFPYFGKCPSPDVQENFDMAKFEGRWYEIKRTMSFLQIGSRCTSTNFTDSGYGDGSYEILNEGRSPLIKLHKSVRLIATVPDEKEPAKMVLRLSDLSMHGNYWVLSTDYDNYAIIWSCNHIWLTLKYARTENLWVHSRHRQLSEDVQKKVDDILESIKYVRVKHLLKNVSQKNCDDDDDADDENSTQSSPDKNDV